MNFSETIIMKTKKTASAKALSVAFASSALAAALIATPATAQAGAKKSERCGDIVKAGKNSCAVKALGISCQGNAKEDNMKGAWIKVPTGTCANIVAICAGDAEAPEGTKEKKLAKACSKIAPQQEGVVGGQLVNKYGEPIES